MSDPHILTITLAPATAADVDAAVSRGEYENPAEVVLEAVAEWRLRRNIESADLEQLRRLAQEGIESGPGLEGDEVFASFKARYSYPSRG